MLKTLRYITLLIALATCMVTGKVMGQSLEHQTINSGSVYLKNSAGGLNITTGQSIIGVASDSTIILTQGFNQPDCDLNLELGPVPTVCENDAPVQLYASIPGGVFSGNGVIGNVIDPQISGAGTFQLAYRVDLNGCKDSAFATYIVKPKPTVNLVLNDSVCIGDTFRLDQGTPANGVYTGLGVSNNGGSYSFIPNLSGIGTHAIDYTYTATNGCSDTKTGSYNVIPNPTVVLSLPQMVVCPGTDTLVLSGGTPSSGYFSGNGVDASGSFFLPDSAGPGIQLITYNLEDTLRGCYGTTIDFLMVDSLPSNLSISFNNALCNNGSNQFLNAAQPLGGNYLGLSQGLTPGGFIHLDSITPGNYPISYAFATPFGCTDTVTDNLTINAPTKPVLADIAKLCSNDTITNLATAIPNGGVYLGAGVANNQLTPNQLSIGQNAYFYQYTDSNNCTALDTAIVNLINPIPVQNTLPSFICENVDPLNLDSLTNFAGSQYNGAGVLGNVFNPLLVGAGNTSMVYTAGIDSNNCASSDSVLVNISTPTPTSFSMQGVCNNSTRIKLTGGSPAGGIYSGPFVDSLGYFNPNLAQNNTDLYYSYTNLLGCTSSDTFNLNLFQVQRPVITEIPAVCNNDSAFNLTAIPNGGTFSGLGVNNGMLQPNQISASNTTIFYSYTDANNCISIDTTVIDILTAPIIQDSLLRKDICYGDFAYFNLPNDKIYLWSDGKIGANHRLNPDSTTNYAVTISDAFCASVKAVSVQVWQKPEFTVITQNPNCEAENGKIIVTASGSLGPYDFLWSSGHSETSIAPYLGAGVYELTVTDVKGCKSVETYGLSNLNAPQPLGHTINGLNCHNDAIGDISVNLDPTGQYNYSWLKGDSTLTINNLVAGSYFFTLEDENTSCISVNEYRIENPKPISISPQIIPASCSNNSGRIELNVFGVAGTAQYNWSSSETVNQIQNKPSGIYAVTVTDGNNCQDSLDLFIPNNNRLFVQLDTFSLPSCGNNSGALALKSLGPNYNVVWNSVDTSLGIQNLSQGLYKVAISDGACTSSFPFFIENEKPLQPEICKVTIDTSTAKAEVIWQGNGENQYLYRRGIQEGAYELIYTDTSANQITFIDNEYVSSDVPLSYKVLTENTCGDISYDDEYLKSIFLSAIKNKNEVKIRLKWADENDLSDVVEYIVYGKKEGSPYFDQISIVSAPQTSYELDSLGEYTGFLVEALVDFCGSTESMFSNITKRIYIDEPIDEPIFIHENFIAETSVNVFPNPTRNLTTVFFENSPKQEIWFTLFGANGQMVLRTKVNPVAGQKAFQLQLGELSSSSYSLRIEYDGKVENIKLLVN